MSLALKEYNMCEWLRERSKIYLKKFVASCPILNRNNFKSLQRWAESKYRVLLMRTPVKLFYLMRLWHQEVFQHFSCVRTLAFRYGTFFLNKNRLAQLIVQYEESTPSNYLNRICLSFEHLFLYHVLSHLTKRHYTEHYIYYYKYPDFIRERMGWIDDQRDTDYGSWPLDYICLLYTSPSPRD